MSHRRISAQPLQLWNYSNWGNGLQENSRHTGKNLPLAGLCGGLFHLMYHRDTVVETQKLSSFIMYAMIEKEAG